MKLVLDTNTVISALLFRGATSRLVEVWQQGGVRLLASPAMVAEYLRVLHYPKFELDEKLIAGLLNESLLPYLEPAVPARGRLAHPCADPDDDLFLRAALGGRAEALVSGDKAVLALDGRYPFRIYSPAQVLAALKASRVE